MPRVAHEARPRAAKTLAGWRTATKVLHRQGVHCPPSAPPTNPPLAEAAGRAPSFFSSPRMRSCSPNRFPWPAAAHQDADRLRCARDRPRRARADTSDPALAAVGVEPAEEGSRRHDGDQCFERPNRGLGELDQLAPFPRRHLHDARRLRPQNLILDFEELNVADQALGPKAAAVYSRCGSRSVSYGEIGVWRRRMAFPSARQPVSDSFP